jgi:hypothetical protein
MFPMNPRAVGSAWLTMAVVDWRGHGSYPRALAKLRERTLASSRVPTSLLRSACLVLLVTPHVPLRCRCAGHRPRPAMVSYGGARHAPSDTRPRELRSRFLCGVPTSPNPPPASPTLPSLSRTDRLICSAPSLLPLFPSATHPSAATLSIVVQLLRAEGSPFASFHLQGPLHLSSLRTIGGVEGTNVGLKLSQGRSQKRMPPGSVWAQPT